METRRNRPAAEKPAHQATPAATMDANIMIGGAMKPFSIGLIRVITLDDPFDIDAHGRIIEAGFAGLQVESRCIPSQPEGVHSPALEALAAPKVAEVARTFADKDMILVSCVDDPGLELARAATPGVPVAGAGQCTVAAALRYGRRIAVLGITDQAPKAFRRMLACAESPAAADAPAVLVGNFRPHGVHSTLDLRTPEGRASCLETARRVREIGADVIALGCTGMATMGIAAQIERETGLPVVDPVLAMGAFASLEAARRR